MKTLKLLFAAVAAVLMVGVAQAERTAKAVLSDEGRKLTFVWDAIDDYGVKNENWFSVKEAETNDTLTVPPWYNACHQKVTTVAFDASFADYRPKKCECWFYKFTELTELIGVESLNISATTNLCCMFEGCSSLTKLDLTDFDTSKVMNLHGMFKDCSSLRKIYASEKFVTDNVTQSQYMFTGCTSLFGGNGTRYDPNHVDASYALIDREEQLPTSVNPVVYKGYFTRKGAVVWYDGYSELHFCYGDGVPAGLDPDKRWALDDELVLENHPWTAYEGTSGKKICTVVFDKSFAAYRPKSFAGWFKGLSNLTRIDGIRYLNVSEATSLESMFEGCSGLETLDLSAFNTAKATSMAKMFKNCSALKTIYACDMFTTEGMTAGGEEFAGCTSLKGGKGTAWRSDAIGRSLAKVDAGTSSKGYFSAAPRALFQRNSRRLFFCCDAVDYTKQGNPVVYSLIEDQRTVDPLAITWAGDTKDFVTIVKIDSSFSDFPLQRCASWFSEFTKLDTVVGLGNLNLDTADSLEKMFAGCTALREVDLSELSVENIVNMDQMFARCTALTELDLSSFRSGNLRTADLMFYGCSSLKTIYASADFTILPFGGGVDMAPFGGCVSLVGGNGTSYMATQVSIARACIDLPGQPGYFTAHPTAVYDRTAQRLTFYCDGVKHVGVDYDVEAASEIGVVSIPWSKVANVITEVVFDESFKTFRPKSCAQWFQDFVKLTRLTGLENLNLSETENLSYMFFGCSELTELDLTSFDTAKVTNMTGLFNSCGKLVTIYASDKFATQSVTSSSLIFTGCDLLVGGKGTSYAANPQGGIAYARIDAAGTPGFFTRKLRVAIDDIEEGGVSNKTVYNGFIGEGKLEGTFSLTVDKPKRGVRTAKATMTIVAAATGKNVKKTGVVNLDTGLVESGELVGLVIGARGVSGEVSGVRVQGVVDAAKGKIQAALNVLRTFDKRQYAVVLEDPDGERAMLTVVFSSKGKAKVAGTYKDAKVSASAQASVGDTVVMLPIVYAKKDVSISCVLWFDLEEDNALFDVTELGDGWMEIDSGRAAAAATPCDYCFLMFDTDVLSVVPDRIKETPMEVDVTWDGKKFDAGKAAKVIYKNGELKIDTTKGDNISSLKLKYTKGSLSGSFIIHALTNGKLVKNTFKLSGVCVNGSGYAIATNKKLGSIPVWIDPYR